jgi:succinoglycan biosynthesis transport protein ExoP
MSAGERWEQVRERDTRVRLLTILRRRWLIAVGVVVVCAGISAFHHARQSKSYTATANVTFQSGTLSESALQVSPSGSTEPLREADTEVFIAHSLEVAEGVRRQLHTRLTASELLEQVKVEAEPNANVLNIIASSGVPAVAARLANAFADQYIEFRAKSELTDIGTVQNRLQQELSALPAGSIERTNLQQSLQRLAELRAVAGGGASIIGAASPPTKPTGSSLTTAVIIGLLIGIAVAFAAVFTAESLDRRIKTVAEFEQEYRLPALTEVTQAAFRPRRALDRGDSLEPYRILRSALDFAAVTRQIDTLMVTSAVLGEGKTTVAVDLAHAIALTGRRVVLVELDLRRPSFAEHFNFATNEGLTDALTQGRPVSDLLVEPFPDLPNLSVLPAGRLPHNPSELLGSERIAEIITGLLDGDSMVIVDAPPLNPIADAQVLINSPAIHASIVVARVNKTSREDARRARGILDRQMVEPLGIVVTGLPESGRYGYGYGYGPVVSESPVLDVKVDELGAARPKSRDLSL